jgi:hypothetical protein
MMRTKIERIGTIAIPAGKYRETYEFAAWFKDYDCKEQNADVCLSRNPEGWPASIHWSAKGVCVDAYLASHFGGVAYGNDPAGKAAIGTEGKVIFSCYAYCLPDNLTLSAEYKWLADRSRWPREVANRRLRIALEHGETWPCIARNWSVDFLRSHGDSDLVGSISAAHS